MDTAIEFQVDPGEFDLKQRMGYRRIQRALANLGHQCARSTIDDTLRQGIEAAPERNRKTSWKEFLKQHWELILAADS